jgi:hypothetical protein
LIDALLEDYDYGINFYSFILFWFLGNGRGVWECWGWGMGALFNCGDTIAGQLCNQISSFYSEDQVPIEIYE